MSTNAAKADVAEIQALRAGASPRDLEIARKYLGNKNFAGYCQRFVRQVTGGRTTGASAIQAWNNAPQKVQGTTSGIQPGDLVYFSPNASNKGYGHTGIYAGNGNFVSATDNGIKETGIMGWLKSTGQKLLGYVPGTNRTLGLGGQQNSQPNQMGFNPPTPEQAIGHNVQMRQRGLASQVPVPMPPVSSTIELDPSKMSQSSNLGQYA